MGADAGHRRLQARRVAREASRRLGDRALKAAAEQRARQSALAFQPLEQRPRLFAQFLRQRFENARPGGGIGDEAQMRFLQQDELGVARQSTRQRVGQAERKRERQHADAVGAAEPGGKRGDRAAHDVDEGIARAQVAPGALGVDSRRSRRAAAGLDDPRPEHAQRAELRQGDELVGVRRQAKRDRRRRVVERKAVFAERAHIGERPGEREGELLRRRSPGGVNAASVGGQIRA